MNTIEVRTPFLKLNFMYKKHFFWPKIFYFLEVNFLQCYLTLCNEFFQLFFDHSLPFSKIHGSVRTYTGCPKIGILRYLYLEMSRDTLAKN